MSDRRFRFGLVAAPTMSGDEWVGLARRAESLGYDILLVPDVPETGSPFPAAGIAAGATTALRVGTFVLVAPVRTPSSIAAESRTLDRLSNGRFELGLGTGRPGAEALAAQLGTEFPPAAERIARVGAAAEAVRAAAAPGTAGPGAANPGGVGARTGPRILVAGAGPRILTLAAQVADTITIALPPSADEAALAQAVGSLRESAGDRFEQIELALNLAAVGEKPVPGLERWLGGTPAELAARGAIGVLTGTPAEMADRLSRRRDELGISYVAANAAAIDDLAPVVERLTGT
ncbi:LLM class flavin-dependent oxidoreductase [Cryptosporangium phraense]|uniref:LLM class flavin-dependent oxidoreductase n=1 Tax=Cryptosporangium phraense TaxID=2593070 RepID=A0A545AQF6_9ACTN|nr:LLM class flavin-dependent oxidoreductase [Cryptosporangium phraense]TQS43568.1 LLM class flavin-dependent oxidoreductase [Cryptosporangium phraense]